MKFLYERSAWFLSHFSRSLSIHSDFSPPKLLSLTPNFIPKSSSTLILFFFTGKVLNPSLHHAFQIFYLTFGVFGKFWGFSKSMKFLLNFWDGFCQNDVKCSCIASHLHYNNVSCILDVCLLCCIDCVLLSLDLAKPMMHLNLQVTCSCIFMHTYLQVFIFLYICLVGAFLIISLSPSLSLSFLC